MPSWRAHGRAHREVRVGTADDAVARERRTEELRHRVLHTVQVDRAGHDDLEHEEEQQRQREREEQEETIARRACGSGARPDRRQAPPHSRGIFLGELRGRRPRGWAGGPSDRRAPRRASSAQPVNACSTAVGTPVSTDDHSVVDDHLVTVEPRQRVGGDAVRHPEGRRARAWDPCRVVRACRARRAHPAR